MKTTFRILLFSMLLISTTTSVDAQWFRKKKPVQEAPPKKEGVKSIKEVTKNCKKMDGLFTLYQDTIKGNLYLEISENQIGKEFIHFSQVRDGVLDAGYFKGSYRGSRIFEVRKYFNRIELVLDNTSYYFDPENALWKASKANINQPVFLSEEIQGIDKETGNMLIKADNLFVDETFIQIKPFYDPKNPNRFKLGKLNKDKSKYKKIGNYPKNTDVTVNYIFDNPTPAVRGSQAVTDGRFIGIELYHSLIEVPENDYQVRYDDPRIGYFTTQVNDMTSTSSANYRDMIHRWHLVKKDPDAKISEPVEPIVWWIENTTPEEFRPIVEDAVLRWNDAFEKIGFKNAVQVNIQPDDADWDAADIRYNVIRWTSSPNPPFGGYGPSFVNPRTGQILGADVMIEFASITRRLDRERVFERAGFFFEQEDDHDSDHQFCSMGKYMQHATLLGYTMIDAMGMDKLAEKEFVKEILYRLMLHEVGHTLGLNHNFKGSLMNTPEDIFDLDIQQSRGLASTVMEYPAINFSPDGKKQGLYFDTKPGPYDFWVIDFGYSPSLADEAAEKERLNRILAQSTKPELAFANDADDMRSSGKGLDPNAMIFDLTSDPIEYARIRMDLVNATYPRLKDKYLVEGNTHHELRNAFLVLSAEYASSLRVVTRHIGGVHVDRALVGQPGADIPLKPVAKSSQKKAIETLNKYAFSSEAFSYPDQLINYLQMQRRGFNHYSSPEDPKIHQRILNIQKDLLDHLLHKNVLNRIVDTEIYGNEYPLTEYLNDLTNAIFQADQRKQVNHVRKNLQVEYVERLIAILNDAKSPFTPVVKSNIHNQLAKVKSMSQSAASPDESTKAHRQYVLYLIEEGMKKG
jgi:hypothetical protein